MVPRSHYRVTLEQKKQHFAFQIIALHLYTCQVLLLLLLGEKVEAELSQRRPWGDCTGVGARTDILLMLRGGCEVGLLCGAGIVFRSSRVNSGRLCTY